MDSLNYTFTLPNACDRILWNPVRKFDIYHAISRCFWMLSGNDRVKDIAFYQPKATWFSDDTLTLTGSDYGKRLFMPEPGLNQIKSIIERIEKDHGTRRALAVIYRPEDAVRDSKDIPCALGLSFHVRNGALLPTMLMRSNAAWGLLPYNVFEFTLLAELVAAIVGLPLGEYNHFALSMHLYAGGEDRLDEIPKARDAVAATPGELPPPMPPMPRMTLDDVARICRWEAELRHAAPGINVTNYRDYVRRCHDEYDPYWADMCLALLAYVLLGDKRITAGTTVLTDIREPLAAALRAHPMSQAANVPGLEEDEVLLESRLNLIRYGAGAGLSEAAREELWGGYRDEYTPAPAEDERRRQQPVTQEDWGRRHRDRERRARDKQTELFEE